MSIVVILWTDWSVHADCLVGTPTGVPSMASKRHLGRSRQRQAILEQAIPTYAECACGNDVQVIADRAGVGSTVYRYFHNKEDLFWRQLEVLLWLERHLFGAMEVEGPALNPRGGGRLCGVFRVQPQYLEMFVQDRAELAVPDRTPRVSPEADPAIRRHPPARGRSRRIAPGGYASDDACAGQPPLWHCRYRLSSDVGVGRANGRAFHRPFSARDSCERSSRCGIFLFDWESEIMSATLVERPEMSVSPLSVKQPVEKQPKGSGPATTPPKPRPRRGLLIVVCAVVAGRGW